MKDESVLSLSKQTLSTEVSEKENTAEDFNFAGRAMPTTNIEVHGGDESIKDMSCDLSTMFESNLSKVNSGSGHMKRKLTAIEQNEFRGASLVRRAGSVEETVKDVTF